MNGSAQKHLHPFFLTSAGWQIALLSVVWHGTCEKLAALLSFNWQEWFDLVLL